MPRERLPPGRPNLARLQQAHEEEISQRASAQGQAAAADSAQARQDQLFADARNSLALIADALHHALLEAAPSIDRTDGNNERWALQLGNATLRLTEPVQHADPRGSLPFEVVAHATLGLKGDGSHGYQGRSHSLWYCDAEEAERFAWCEVAFMESPLLGGSRDIAPFALTPSEGAVAFSPAMGTKQLARSIRPLSTDELEDFVTRWADWFADAYNGSLRMPSRLPEEEIQQNYRGAR